ncbi:MAG: TnpV protein [Eubacteriales bacterium]
MKELTTFEKWGVEYEERDGLLYPLIFMDDDMVDHVPVDIGKYGRAWVKYMETTHPYRHMILRNSQCLKDVAAEVNEEAYERLEQIEEEWLAKQDVHLVKDFMLKIQLRNQARMIAEEIIYDEIVHKIH